MHNHNNTNNVGHFFDTMKSFWPFSGRPGEAYWKRYVR